ncbi:MAG TPA: 4-hydroxy-3-methylbut-2-enyl diphosphate reductase, partial [Planctomycetaceae bacterium]|nr:4-hydroxy-3-methylbut-2-enyl diphosphate reductase [Planctomycetaceae bacterium]
LEQRGFLNCSETERTIPAAATQVMITAHGVSDHVRLKLASTGLTVIDTTCPLVRRVHAAAQRLASEGRHVIVIGQPGHVEVRGITEDLSSYSVWPDAATVQTLAVNRLGAIAQSTTRPDVAADVLAEVRRRNAHAEIVWIDTICQPTRDRQEALEELLAVVTVLVVVGGLRSNNSRALQQRALDHGRRAYLIQTAEELHPDWFEPDDIVGLTAGTSTPDDIIDAVASRLDQLAAMANTADPTLR